MCKKGRLEIEYVILLIIAAIVLIGAVYWYINSSGAIKGKIKEVSEEFTGQLDDLSLGQLRDNVRKNPGGVLQGIINACEKNDLKACRQYISICESSENDENTLNKLGKEEIDLLREYCTLTDTEKAKQVLAINSEGEAEKLYLEYLETNDEEIRVAILEELEGKYGDSDIFRILSLYKSSDKEFAAKERDLYVKLNRENDYNNLIYKGLNIFQCHL